MTAAKSALGTGREDSEGAKSAGIGRTEANKRVEETEKSILTETERTGTGLVEESRGEGTEDTQCRV